MAEEHMEDLEPDAVAARAVQLMDPRIAAVRELASRRLAVRELEAQLAAALEADGAAYQEAAKSWTEKDLRRLGFPPPRKRIQGRPAQGGRGRRGRAQVEPVPGDQVPPFVRDAARVDEPALVG